MCPVLPTCSPQDLVGTSGQFAYAVPPVCGTWQLAGHPCSGGAQRGVCGRGEAPPLTSVRPDLSPTVVAATLAETGLVSLGTLLLLASRLLFVFISVYYYYQVGRKPKKV